MSPDNVFASQMWNWPDPVIKRDESGRILFLNAAFLSIYGGRVEDWQGNTVMGWPAPQNTTEVNRFETRLPSESGEFVFDWIEYSQGGGVALAIARDVTAFVTTPIAATPAPQAQPIQQETQQAPSQHVEVAAAPEYTQPAEPVTPAPVVTAEPQPVNPPIAEAAQPPAIQIAPPRETPQKDMMSVVPDTPTQPAAPAPEPVAPPPAQTAEGEPATRDFERRALPIENQDAVLGTNWRDAVIARAVSSEDAEEGADAEGADAQDADIQQVSEPGSGFRILLAEDNAINALLTRTLLEAEGCIVDVVEDGALAVEAVKKAAYDMIFMDMRMPNMDGLESTRKIRALPNTSGSLPIIALTANAFDDDRNACFDSGMNDFMTKPVSAEELSAMVQTWTEKSKAA